MTGSASFAGFTFVLSRTRQYDGDSVHVVVNGHFAFRVETPQGDASTLRIFGPGETFGRVTIPGRVTPRLGTIVALDAGETFELSRAR